MSPLVGGVTKLAAVSFWGKGPGQRIICESVGFQGCNPLRLESCQSSYALRITGTALLGCPLACRTNLWSCNVENAAAYAITVLALFV